MSYRAKNEQFLFKGGALLVGSSLVWVFVGGGLMTLVGTAIGITTTAAFIDGLAKKGGRHGRGR